MHPQQASFHTSFAQSPYFSLWLSPGHSPLLHTVKQSSEIRVMTCRKARLSPTIPESRRHYNDPHGETTTTISSETSRAMTMAARPKLRVSSAAISFCFFILFPSLHQPTIDSETRLMKTENRKQKSIRYSKEEERRYHGYPHYSCENCGPGSLS